MKGIWFNDVHSYDDLNLILSKVDIPPAILKSSYIDVPASDGAIDMTEVHGKHYKNRDCVFTFSVLPTDDFESKKTEVSNLLNGGRFKIRLDKDSEYYYDGRCEVNKYECKKMLRKITVKAKVAPYKYKINQTTVSANLIAPTTETSSGEQGVVLNSISHVPHEIAVNVIGNELADNTETTVSAVGKNLLDIPTTTATGTHAYCNAFLGDFYLPSGTYTFSCDMEHEGTQMGQVSFRGYNTLDVYLDAKTFKGSGHFTMNFTVPESQVGVRIYMYSNVSATATYSKCTISNVMVNAGTVELPYEPFHAQTLTLPTTELWRIPVVTGGNITDSSGQMWLCNTVDLARNKSIKRTDLVDLGSLTWKYQADHQRFMGEISNMQNLDQNEKTDIVCEKYVSSTAKTNNTTFHYLNRVYIYDSAYTDPTTFKSAMSGVYLLYPVANITETPITGTTYFPPTALLASGGIVLNAIYQKSNGQTITLKNSKKPVVPVIECTTPTSLIFKDQTVVLNAGKHKVLDFCLEQGNNKFTAYGSGKITFTYQEGDL